MNDPKQQFYGQPVQPEFNAAPSHAGYPPTGGYAPQIGFAPQPTQPTSVSDGPKGFAESSGGYPPSGGYVPSGGYPPSAGYPPSGGYPSAGGYPPSGGYPPYAPLPEYGSGYVDPENPDGGEPKGFGFSDESIRKGFIKKVYSILSIQLTLSGGMIALFLLHEPLNLWVRESPMLWLLSIILVFGTLIPMACCESARRNSPMNFILLGLFTLAQSFLLAIISGTYRAEEVLLAVVITATICIGLTIFAFQTRWDFTVMGGVLFIALIILILFGIISIFFPGHTVKLIYASLGALVFSAYLIYDTQLMMGGSHKYSISPEEYIFAALNLYLDIINIFIYILRIIGASRQ